MFHMSFFVVPQQHAGKSQFSKFSEQNQLNGILSNFPSSVALVYFDLRCQTFEDGEASAHEP